MQWDLHKQSPSSLENVKNHFLLLLTTAELSVSAVVAAERDGRHRAAESWEMDGDGEDDWKSLHLSAWGPVRGRLSWAPQALLCPVCQPMPTGLTLMKGTASSNHLIDVDRRRQIEWVIIRVRIGRNDPERLQNDRPSIRSIHTRSGPLFRITAESLADFRFDSHQKPNLTPGYYRDLISLINNMRKGVNISPENPFNCVFSECSASSVMSL